MRRYEVYQDNNDTITLFVIANDIPIWAYSGYEYGGNYKEQIDKFRDMTLNEICKTGGSGIYNGKVFTPWKECGYDALYLAYENESHTSKLIYKRGAGGGIV